MTRDLFRFDLGDAAASWFAIDDRVMGGVSQSRLRAAEGFAVFEGEVSLAHGGGFASVRTRPADLGDACAAGYVLDVRGDGRRYKLVLHVEDTFDGVSYQVAFIASEGIWGEIRFAISDFRAMFRGRSVSGTAPLDPARVRQAGFVIGDRQSGAFALAIRCLRTV